MPGLDVLPSTSSADQGCGPADILRIAGSPTAADGITRRSPRDVHRTHLAHSARGVEPVDIWRVPNTCVKPAAWGSDRRCATRALGAIADTTNFGFDTHSPFACDIASLYEDCKAARYLPPLSPRQRKHSPQWC
jgi:hypothetical protein